MSFRRGLLLDMDGTIADSLDALFAVYSEFLLAHAKSASYAEFQELNGIPLKEALLILKERHNLLPDLSLLLNDYQKRLPNVSMQSKPRAGLPELLRWAKAQRWGVALVTSASMHHAESWLQNFSLRDFFDVLVTGDRVVRGKPDPEPYLQAMSLLQVSPENSFAVEDSEIGLRSALGSRAKTFLLASGGKPIWFQNPIWKGVEQVEDLTSLQRILHQYV